MKKLFIAVISMAALASCAQEDIVINNANNAIAFDNAFVSTTTKAIDPSITTDSITDFQVWGNTKGDHTGAPVVPIFTNETVSKVSGNWTYDVDKTQYWIDGNTYNFAAVKNGNVTELADGLPKTINYSLINDTPGPDLLYASYGPYEAEATGNSEVPFTFAHLLSKAVFTFENTTPDKKDGATTQPANIYKVTNIRVSGLDAGADYVIENGVGAWTDNANGDREEYFGDIVGADETAVKSAAEIREKQIGKSNYERLLIPGTHNVTITCKITLYNDYVDDSRIVDVIDYSKEVELTFQKGVAYNLILKAGLQQSIEFKVVKVENWNDPVDVNTPEQGHDNTPSA